ncbi:Predicted nucleic acid-binding protein, contains PIN domain [Methylobacterium sp. 174MFSha1.1]|uniref:PIN domain-containing protein n=1 Tax=Methylobacterium sp. 174MFSha1.1 TaxID=1502749 RepID=UPI0008E6FAA0|nr:PIN domain-containing protein [Methylobacterium sp. 174MFSha1.1]SFV11604.1 Predicted nucleic acid-binding protein, contains PIN domain [Methylobacterium sp. 174MFSha1.1]
MIVVDASVLVRGIRSRDGASHLVVRAMLAGMVAFAASPAVVIEYEDVLKRPGHLGADPWITPAEIDVILDALCARAIPALPRFRFRPFLADPKDDLYIDCALAAGADTIVTEDRHFGHPAVAAFGLSAISAAAFVTTNPELRTQKRS